MPVRARTSIVLALAAVLAPGCGGSGGPDDIVVALGGEAALDGYVRSDTGTAHPDGGGPFMGDFVFFGNRVARQFFSFAFVGLPASGQLVSATIRLNQQVVSGTPFTGLGSVLLEHVDYGATLNSSDFGISPLPGGALVLASDASLGVKELDVTTFVASDLAAGRTRSQFRLRFSLMDTDSDSSDDLVQYTDTENSITGTGVPPQLVLTFAP